MKGYLNNPEATSEAIDQYRWLHTGDLAYFDSDGYFYIVDRIKEMIKYQGHQVIWLQNINSSKTSSLNLL